MRHTLRFGRPFLAAAAAPAAAGLAAHSSSSSRCDGWGVGSGKKGCPTATPVTVRSPVPPDIEVSQQVPLTPVKEVFTKAFGLKEGDVFSFGPYKGKLSLGVYDRFKDKPNGHYVVVCGINPTPLGEGKSTTTVGLSQALGAHLGQKVLTCIRQPSMGPTFGIKGGAAGGGYSQVVPMEDFNLHMTGDIHAITAAHNLFAAAIDTRYYHENSSSADGIFKRLCPADKAGNRSFEPSMYARLEKLGLAHKKHDPNLLTPEEIQRFCVLDIDPDTITWRRVTDCNDKYLRNVEIGRSPSEFSKRLDKQLSRESSFAITVSSEIMAILALATDLKDLRARLGRMICCFSKKGEPLTADDFGITGALTVLMMDALQPNTFQTVEGTPALVHAGPFANIAHGNSSIIADKIGLKLVGKDGFVLTEAGFGADMGGEKFFNIKCHYSGLKPDCAVIVCSIRALKLHSCEAPKVVAGQALSKEYTQENVELVEKGCANLVAHIEGVRKRGVKVVVAINRFATDTPAEHEVVKRVAEAHGASAAVVAEHFAKGGAGAVDLGRAVMAACSEGSDFKPLYDPAAEPIKAKILKIVQDVYGGADVRYSEKAEAVIERYEKDPAISSLPICMSKNQYSLTDDPKRLGAPKGFTITVRDIYVSAGAGFLVASLGEITFIPGLPIKPAYYKIDLDFSTDPPRVTGLS
uniref:formate--tetrahydrofolate ligase n=1 Tax=Alexandrium catenella TaxID=2925 RepID=A0A7S1RI50_ALECA